MPTTPALSYARGPDPFPVPLRIRVLVVDDCPDAATTTAHLLRVCGADARACPDGPAALAALTDFRPDACVLDLGMPGMDGCQLAARMRAADRGTPLLLVALTGRADAQTRQRADEAGFDLYFEKPADPARLLAALGGHAARPGGN